MYVPKSIIFLSITFLLLTTACAQENKLTRKPNVSKMANPASEKCINDGYELREKKSALGISSEYYCFNRKNSKQCEEWAYFRNQCSLN